MAGRVEARLSELGIELPAPATPAAMYVPWVRTGNLVFIAGQIPSWNGERKYLGRVGVEFSLEEGQQAARLVALHVLAQLKAACEGDLDRVVRCVRLGGFVACPPEFLQHPAVINGASELMIQVFGEAGKHARAAVGSSSLPFGVAVEVDAVFEIQ